MRSYLAIIKDSFREAMASRTLWVLLFCLAGLLLTLAPFGYREEITVGVDDDSIRELPLFILRVKVEAEQDKPSPSRAIWNGLDESIRNKLEHLELPEEGDFSAAVEFMRIFRRFVKGLDALTRKPDFCQGEDWQDVKLVSAEAIKLKQDWDDLNNDEKRRFNRLMLEAAYPDQIRSSPATSVVFRYLNWDVGPPLPLREQEFAVVLESMIAFVIEWFVGGIGVLAAVLVTAPILPRTLEGGSINLLLSKPITRWALFLTKYLGGCAFILINAAFLIVGLWLILGLRFGMWNQGLLLCIPVYVLVFAVYYSVSALAGAMWRSTIVAIAVTILFYVTCAMVGWSKAKLESVYLDKTRIVQLVPIKDRLIAVNEVGLANRWNEAEQRWDEVFRSEQQRQMGAALFAAPLEGSPRLLRPIYDAKQDRLVAAHRSMRMRGMVLLVGSREDGWAATEGASLPPGCFALLREPDGGILAVSNLGIFRLEGDPLEKDEAANGRGFGLPFSSNSPFKNVGPGSEVVFLEPAAAALNPETGDLAVYSRGRITRFAKADTGRYEVQAERVLEEDGGQTVVLGYGGDTLLVGQMEGNLYKLDGKTLKDQKLLTPERGAPVRFIRFAPGGRRAAIVCHDRRLLIFDARDDSLVAAKVSGQGDISSAEFTAPDRLLVADRFTRVLAYDVTTDKVEQRYTPELNMVDRIYRYALKPLYTIFPKPGELDRTVVYLMTGKDVETLDQQRVDSAAIRRQLRPWAPVWSSLIFATVVLTLGCLCVQRQEF